MMIGLGEVALILIGVNLASYLWLVIFIKKTKRPKLLCLQDYLTREEQAKFLEMLQKEYPKVYDAYLKNTEIMEKYR